MASYNQMISLPYRHQLVSLLLVLVLVLQPPSARAIVYNVSASGTGLDLYEAMDLAEAGDTVSLADGTYDGAIVSTRDGTKDNPITVVGGADAIINGEFGDRSVHITHSFMTLKVGRYMTAPSSNCVDEYAAAPVQCLFMCASVCVCGKCRPSYVRRVCLACVGLLVCCCVQ